MSLQSERDKVAHLLRRFGLGASEAETEYYGAGGHKAAIQKLLDYEKVDEGFDITPQQLANQNGQIQLRTIQAWWVLRLLVTRRPLQERLTIFWHDHFATSAMKVDVPGAMFTHIEVLRAGAGGRFEDLLVNVSKDPAMVYWLDNQFNVKGKPNENFAREIMELFTLGIGNYTEKDIQEASRAFTGWTFGVGPRGRVLDKPRGAAKFVFREDLHDDGRKAFLSNSGNFSGDDVCGILCGNPQTARYIVTKFWEWFAYPNPEPALIERLTTSFRSSGLNIKGLVRSIMESSEFYSDKAERAVYKNPIDFTISTLRQLGVGGPIVERIKNSEQGQALRQLIPVQALLNSTKSMGMELLYPPDVAGWDGGASWISSATMVERIKWADRIFAVTPPGGRGNASLRFPAATLFSPGETPQSFARSLVSLFDAKLPDSKIKQLEAAAEAAAASGANAMANAVTRLIFGSPEFQFA